MAKPGLDGPIGTSNGAPVESGVVHRPQLGDFGISKELHAETLAQTMLGTPFYMSPELLQGKSYLCPHKTDVWVNACVPIHADLGTLQRAVCSFASQIPRRDSLHFKQTVLACHSQCISGGAASCMRVGIRVLHRLSATHESIV